MPPKGGQNKVVMDELVDVDSFLDSYLAQLQSDGAPAGNQSQNQLQNGPFGDLQTDSLLFGQQQGAPGRFAFIDPNMQVPLGMQVASGAQFGGQQGLAVQQANGAGPSRAAAAAAPGSQNNGRGTRQSTRQRAPKKHLSESPDEVGTSGDDSGEDRKPARKRGEAVDSAEAARRAQALQEKNRRAQRRFRERQKHKIHELHDQIEQLTRKVSPAAGADLHLVFSSRPARGSEGVGRGDLHTLWRLVCSSHHGTGRQARGDGRAAARCTCSVDVCCGATWRHGCRACTRVPPPPLGAHT